MKRRLIIIALILGTAVPAGAQELRSLDIRARLNPDGSADITSVWDANVVSGTEYFIPINTGSDIEIEDLRVSEGGREFVSLGTRWDVDRSREWKAGKCGIVRNRDGVELCWGIGDVGDHVWTVSYRVRGMVQSYDDADGLHFMFVNKNIGAPPQKVRLRIENAAGGEEWTCDNTLVWGFGFYGDINVEDGAIVARSFEPFGHDSGLIALVRFEKGLFCPAETQSGTFQNRIDKALRGSSYGEEEKALWAVVVFCIVVALLFFAIAIWILVESANGRIYSKGIFGTNKIDGWYREAPLEGNLMAAWWVLANGGRFIPKGQQKDLIGAFFLRWLLEGKVTLIPDPKKSSRLRLALREGNEFSDDVEESLYKMVVDAAGDGVLDANEFRRWSEKHPAQVAAWPDRAKGSGMAWFVGKGALISKTRLKDEGQKDARKLIEFKNFLKDFTLAAERGSVEVGLWKDYLVYAQLFGIADKVAKEMEKLFPAEIAAAVNETGMDVPYLMRTIRMTRMMSDSMATGAARGYQTGSVKGLGGHTSFGGGGGFSGGGFGGGSR